jgi:hypothetical protein
MARSDDEQAAAASETPAATPINASRGRIIQEIRTPLTKVATNFHQGSSSIGLGKVSS